MQRSQRGKFFNNMGKISKRETVVAVTGARSRHFRASARGTPANAPRGAVPRGGGYPRRKAAASLKQQRRAEPRRAPTALSAAKGRGLIEACGTRATSPRATPLSAAKGRGLIEATAARTARASIAVLSAAKGRGLIEAGERRERRRPMAGYPRRKAAASLKRWLPALVSMVRRGYPRRKAAASLKPTLRRRQYAGRVVIRGERPRPH